MSKGKTCGQCMYFEIDPCGTWGFCELSLEYDVDEDREEEMTACEDFKERDSK